MQITINQTEIETAIRNHVLGLIAVRENMRIDIDLKATRKEDGYTAIIDIYPDDTPEGGEPIKVPTLSTKTPPAEVKPEPKAEAPKAVVEVEAAPVVEVAETVEEKPVTEEVAAAPTKKTTTRGLFKKETAEPKKEAPVAANESGEAPRSIFASLKKPVNTPAPEADAA